MLATHAGYCPQASPTASSKNRVPSKSRCVSSISTIVYIDDVCIYIYIHTHYVVYVIHCVPDVSIYIYLCYKHIYTMVCNYNMLEMSRYKCKYYAELDICTCMYIYIYTYYVIHI